LLEIRNSINNASFRATLSGSTLTITTAPANGALMNGLVPEFSGFRGTPTPFSGGFVPKGNEQVIPELGLALSVDQPRGPASPLDSVREENGFISATLEFKNPTDVWLTGIRDADPVADIFKRGLPSPQNWIRSGDAKFTPGEPQNQVTNDFDEVKDPGSSSPSTIPMDKRQIYEGLLGGRVAPAALAARSFNGTNAGFRSLTMGPIPSGTPTQTGLDQTLTNIGSVNIVLTSDRTKWTKCLVLEMSEEASQSENAAKKFDLRRARNPFVIENGVPVYKPGQNEETGRSWFPGYAVNVETGERLNIIFGEDSYLESENGRDMLWNPTNNNAQFGYQNPATLSDPQAFITRYLWGGKHWIWVMNSRFNVRSLLGTGNPCYKGYEEKAGSRTFGLPYDSGNVYHQILTGCNPYEASLRNIFIGAEWVMLPVLTPNGKFESPEEGFIPT
jgi:hypothetical protein